MRGWSERQVERILGNLLRGGVILSAGVVLMGGMLYLIHYGAASPDYGAFRGEPRDLRGLSGIVTDALSLRRRGIIQLGIVLLIATPVARVAFSVLALARQRDRTYIVVTLIVFAILIFSLAGGRL